MNNNIMGNLVLTQILALCFTISATLCQLMRRDYDLDLSALQMTLMYLLVAIIFWLALVHLSVDYFWKRKFSTSRLSLTLVISIFDCAGSIFSLHSFSYLSVPVVSLLSNVSTPTVMIFSWLLLGAKYRWNNYLGAVSAILGVVLLTVVQNNLSLASGQNSSLFGIFLSISSAVCYGISNVLTEAVMKAGGSMAEFLAFSSSFSFLWSLAYLVIGRRAEIWDYVDNIATWVTPYLVLYLFVMVMFYSLLPIVLSRTSATVFNLSMMTVNIYSLISGVVIFGYRFSWEFILAFILITGGLIFYNIPMATQQEATQEEAKKDMARSSPA